MKATARTIGLLSLLLMLTAGTATAEDRWKSIVDNRSVRDILAMNGSIWSATSGGLIEYNPIRQSFNQYSLPEGLAGIGLRRLAPDSSGGFWIVFENRILQRFEPGIGVTHTVNKLAESSEITQIRDITVTVNDIYIATNIGVARISHAENIDRWVWRTNYTYIGTFAPKSPVNAVAVEGDYLWVGTANGLARGDLTTPDPLVWTHYTTANGLPANPVAELLSFNGNLLAATVGGIVKWDDNVWLPFNSLNSVQKLFIQNDSLRALIPNGTAVWLGSSWRTVTRNWLAGATWDSDNRLWGGFTSNNQNHGGIGWLEADGSWEEIELNSPTTNVADYLTFATNGDLLMAGGRGQGQYGLSRWNGVRWDIHTMPDDREAIYTSPFRTLTEDYLGGVWVGTGSKGIARYNSDSTVTLYNDSDSTGARLKPHEWYPTMTIIPDMTSDVIGNIWLLNYGAKGGDVVACIPADFVRNPDGGASWHYIHRTKFNGFPYFTLITTDARGRLWLASDATDASQPAQGVYVYDFNSTPGNPADDRVFGPLKGLNSAQVLSLKYDPAGYMWVGSLDGAYYINAESNDPSVHQFTQLYPTRNVQVNDIAIDPLGNKWIATSFGVTVVDPDLFTIRRTITSDPPDRLPENNVRKLAIDKRTGWVYFATNLGTSALFTPYRDYGTTLSAVTIEPNPFNPNQSRLFFTGNTLAKRAGVKIFTVDGRLVRELTYEQAALGWDGLTANGKRTADGVYLILAFTDDGQAARGKVALVWR